jgi:hypothetical protein
MTHAMIYQPPAETKYRVAWYGGERLYFQKHWNMYDVDTDASYMYWLDRDTRILCSIPTQIKDMLLEMENYYHEAIILEKEQLQEMI